MVRIMRRFGVAILILLILPPLLYLGVAFGFAVATPRIDLPGGDGIAIYACDNGVHTDLVLPAAAGGAYWRTDLRSPGATYAAGLTHVSLGWVSRVFYVNTPSWEDFEPMTALKALLWDETVLHVEYRAEPQPGEQCGAWVVGTEDYQRIVSFVRATLADRSPQGPAKIAAGYGPRDAFYAAEGRYTIIETCNQWTGQALRLGGAPVAPWTPFSFLVLWHLPALSP
jgi:uncharacterized protein (TIGR02117 family)